MAEPRSSAPSIGGSQGTQGMIYFPHTPLPYFVKIRRCTQFINLPGLFPVPTVGGSEYRRSSFRKCDRSRRCWSDREEAVLISALKDLVARGWKSDNGFRGGYATKIEEWLKSEIPKTDLRANPHIQSKISAWKKNYYSLSNILDRSGIGFNLHEDFKIDCSDEQWDQIVKVCSFTIPLSLCF